MRLAMHAFDFSQNPSCSEIDVLAVMNDDSQEQVRTTKRSGSIADPGNLRQRAGYYPASKDMFFYPLKLDDCNFGKILGYTESMGAVRI